MSYPKPVIFGEILMDIFPNGSRILGGSALNVAWHLKGLGFSPTLFSRVGSDSLGNEVISRIKKWELTTGRIQIDDQHATGAVEVSFDSTGSPLYQTSFPTAFDFISQATLNPGIGSKIPLLYYGTYSLRHPTARSTLKQLKSSASCIFTDLNLRPPHYSQETIEEALSGAEWVKVNEEEFSECFKMDSTVENALKVIRGRDFSRLLVTRGALGAFYVDKTERVIESKYISSNLQIVDTVGAGDGFSAAMIASIVDGLEVQTAIDLACEFASKICTIRGAIPDESEFYSAIRKLKSL